MIRLFRLAKLDYYQNPVVFPVDKARVDIQYSGERISLGVTESDRPRWVNLSPAEARELSRLLDHVADEAERRR